MKTKLSLFVFALAGLIAPAWSQIPDGKVPIVYHERYNISLWRNIEKLLHYFDSHKYGKVFENLPESIHARGTFSPAEPISWEELEEVHSKKYLKSLSWSFNVACILEVPVAAVLPNSVLQERVLTPMRWATQGTVMACELAMEYGWAINLSGGYHHAHREFGHGLCPFADIQLAIKRLCDKHPGIKVLIVDLDAHQGDGHEADLKNDPDVFVFDMYNKMIFPQDVDAKEGITFDLPLQGGGCLGDTFTWCDFAKRAVDDQEYLGLLMSELPKALDQIKPDFILYNAGTDILASDPLGSLNVSEEGVKQRDAFVFQQARQRNIPIAMTLSGGYSKRSAAVISESVNNLLANVLGEVSSTDVEA